MALALVTEVSAEVDGFPGLVPEDEAADQAGGFASFVGGKK